MDRSMQLVERRIATLERRNSALAAGALALAALGVLAAAGRPGEMRATAFHLVDESGKVRAKLAFHDGAPGVFILDEEGRERLLAIHDAERTGLYLNDADGTTRVGVAQFAHGGGGIALHGAESKGATVLYHKRRGSLTFFDNAGGVTNQVLAIPPPAGPAPER
jgi:hypothetical protein